MSSIFKSSIGKKLIMSISGLFLILFITLHMCLNLTYVFDPTSTVFAGVCEFMSLGIIKVIVPVLAAGFVIHIIYALVLTIGNRKARGEVRYAVSNKAAVDSWSARNMFVLGLIVLLGIALHLTDFWANMQLKEFMGQTPDDVYGLMSNTFASPVVTLLYVIWFAAIWFHLTHGFWSALQTVGWNNQIWLKRWKVICGVYVTLILAGFAFIAIYACAKANGLV
ncbi:MAG: succinate dehydrogenase cytochrome b subunit [Bacteroidales bacterium]|nr:succinate dehydrogenase cytochrome b subunit [Candidatus Cacconaster equifaecalis]MCQ2151631.1 succinate dehydrogenase cytochrome b subunit [Bacteroidales bacterium]